MKIKGITVWEQYVEFFVLVLAAAVFVFFTGLQFIGNPNQVSSAGTDYAPGDVDALLTEEAERIEGGLAPDARSPVPFDDHEPVLPEFLALAGSPTSPERVVRQMWWHPAPESLGPVGGEQGLPYIEPDVSAPYRIVAKQFFNALTPEVVATYDELQERFPEPPYDIGWMTVAAKFNLKDLLEKFRTPGPDGEQAFQERWYANRIDMLDVKLEREEYVEGTWVSRTVLNPIPGQISFREELEGDVNAQTRDDILNDLNETTYQNVIIRPPFLPTVGDWTPPDPEVDQIQEDEEEVELDAAQEAILRKQRLLRNLQSRYQRISAKVVELGGELDRDPDAPDDNSAGGAQGGAGGGPSAGGGARGTGGQGGVIDIGILRQRFKLTKKKRILERQIEQVENDLVGLGAMVVKVEEVDANPDEVIVWAHDMTIERGRTYRYRLTVEIYNPLFAKKLHLPEEQHALANQLALVSDASDWTEAIYSEEWLKIFVTNVTPAADQQLQIGGLGLGLARAEVFRFQHGRWWNATFSVEPGDRIGEMRSQPVPGQQLPLDVDFSTDWYLLDVIEDIGADREMRDRGRAGTIMLQSLSRPAMVVRRDPNREIRSRLLQRLRDDVDLAEIQAEAQTLATGP